MRLAVSDMIQKIDAFAEDKLGISAVTLMERAGRAAADLVRRYVNRGSRIVILAGSGNNGGDGYALAAELVGEYSVAVYDVFSKGQRSEAGKYYLNKYKSLGGTVIECVGITELSQDLRRAACIVDAIFGTGFSGEYSEKIKNIAAMINASDAIKIAIDVPLGIDATNGEREPFAVKMTATLELSFVKCGIVSYPAREYVGEIVCDSLGLPEEKIAENFDFSHILTDKEWVLRNLPQRIANSNKGTYGKTVLLVGSEKYRGAAHLALSAALRSGVGLVAYYGKKDLINELLCLYPEAIYIDSSDTLSEILSRQYNSMLIGSGSGNTKELADKVKSLIESEGGPLVIDADAINSLAGYYGKEALKAAKRQLILTPHPLEFSRISGIPLEKIQASRLTVAKEFAREFGVVLVLKGAGTIITDGSLTYINSTGSSALAKAGSGDVLAGLVASLCAQSVTPLTAAAIAVWLHGRAGDSAQKLYSSYGVTPSDLPIMIAKELAEITEA